MDIHIEKNLSISYHDVVRRPHQLNLVGFGVGGT